MSLNSQKRLLQSSENTIERTTNSKAVEVTYHQQHSVPSTSSTTVNRPGLNRRSCLSNPSRTIGTVHFSLDTDDDLEVDPVPYNQTHLIASTSLNLDSIETASVTTTDEILDDKKSVSKGPASKATVVTVAGLVCVSLLFILSALIVFCTENNEAPLMQKTAWSFLAVGILMLLVCGHLQKKNWVQYMDQMDEDLYFLRLGRNPVWNLLKIDLMDFASTAYSSGVELVQSGRSSTNINALGAVVEQQTLVNEYNPNKSAPATFELAAKI